MVAPQRVLVAAFSDASSYSYGRTRYDASVFLEQALSRTGQVTVIPRQEWQAKIDTITRLMTRLTQTKQWEQTW